MSAYRIIDEPSPGLLVRVVVSPVWPLFALLFAGAWVALPWFVLNAFALGSPTRARETFLAATGFAGSLALAMVVLSLEARGAVAPGAADYARLVVVAGHVLVGFGLYVLQARAFAVYTQLGGPARSGFWIVLLTTVVRARVLSGSPLWALSLS
jgi:hypothetical protein